MVHEEGNSYIYSLLVGQKETRLMFNKILVITSKYALYILCIIFFNCGIYYICVPLLLHIHQS